LKIRKVVEVQEKWFGGLWTSMKKPFDEDNVFMHPINFFLDPINISKIHEYPSPLFHNPLHFKKCISHISKILFQKFTF